MVFITVFLARNLLTALGSIGNVEDLLILKFSKNPARVLERCCGSSRAPREDQEEGGEAVKAAGPEAGAGAGLGVDPALRRRPGAEARPLSLPPQWPRPGRTWPTYNAVIASTAAAEAPWRHLSRQFSNPQGI